MNQFANSLFSLFFGWARSLIQQVWSDASSGQYSGFLSWLGDHWLWVVLILCLGGTALDFMIWMIRWRPYLAWRTAARQWTRRLHPTNVEGYIRFKRGYDESAPLDIGLDSQAPGGEKTEESPMELEEEIPQEEEAPSAPFDPFSSFPPLRESSRQETAPSYGPVAEEPVYAAEEWAYQDEGGRQRQFAPPTGYEPPPMFPSTRPNSAYATDLPTARRRRRSEKYERRRPDWREKLIKGDEDEDRLLDGLPPAVDKQDAFHEPVYPTRQQASFTPYSAWQRPDADTKPNGNRE